MPRVMAMSKWRRVLTLSTALCVITLMSILFSYPYSDPQRLFFKHRRLPLDLCGCPGPCVAELQDDPWFAEHYNRSVHPLMTRDNKQLSEDTFKWWQTLQGSSDRAKFNQVIEELFKLFPIKSLYQDASAGRCRSCAVVGNSGNLLGSFNGRIIDSKDLVIRMNKAPTRGFEDDVGSAGWLQLSGVVWNAGGVIKNGVRDRDPGMNKAPTRGFEDDVGSRTTHHLMYPESAVHLDNDTFLVLIPFKTQDLQWLISAFTGGTVRRTYQAVMSRIEAKREKVQIYHPAFIKYAYSWVERHGRYPSTGFLSLMFALHICDEVNVFGFGADEQGNWHHYWEMNRNAGAFRQTGVHGGDYEYSTMLRLAATNKIKMYFGRR